MRLVAALRAAAAAASLLCLGLLAASGWALAAGYAPSDAEAFASLLYWRTAGGLGAFARSLHVYLASALVTCGFLYLLTTYLADGHRHQPRGWWLALTLYLVVLGWCFTGYLLPMDQSAYWGTRVRLGIVETAPLLGPPAADLLRGGPTPGAATLPRFYALHVSFLPCLALLLAAPLVRRAAAAAKSRPVLWLGGLLAGLTAAYLLAASLPAPLELPADPTDSGYVPRPEWYFLWLFQFGKYVEAVPWVRSVVLPAAGLGLLYALPLLRRQSNAGRNLTAAAWCAAWMALTTLAVWEDRELPPKLSYEAAMRVRAGENYQKYCYDCHGEEGRGDGPESRAFDLDTPDLTTAAVWREKSPEQMREIIVNGEGEDMPAFGKKLAPEEIDALLEYLQTTFRPAAATVAGG